MTSCQARNNFFDRDRMEDCSAHGRQMQNLAGRRAAAIEVDARRVSMSDSRVDGK